MQNVLLNYRYGDNKPGRILSLEDGEAENVVANGVGEYADPPVASEEAEATDAVTLDEFAELSATDQKELLVQLEIEGDASNEEKRSALYADFLKVRDGGGE